jgi:hypothetical protein
VPLLALILFTPWFLILGWAYWTFPKSHAVTPARRRLDIAALLVALALSAFAMRHAYYLPFDGVGKMWPQVIATLAGYHVFLVVLAMAFFVRRWKYRVA